MDKCLKTGHWKMLWLSQPWCMLSVSSIVYIPCSSRFFWRKGKSFCSGKRDSSAQQFFVCLRWFNFFSDSQNSAVCTQTGLRKIIWHSQANTCWLVSSRITCSSCNSETQFFFYFASSKCFFLFVFAWVQQFFRFTKHSTSVCQYSRASRKRTRLGPAQLSAYERCPPTGGVR